jgi:hypothetical protein
VWASLFSGQNRAAYAGVGSLRTPLQVSDITMECCPPSAWNGVRDDGETLSGISMESCPASRGIRTAGVPKVAGSVVEALTKCLEFVNKLDKKAVVLVFTDGMPAMTRQLPPRSS